MSTHEQRKLAMMKIVPGMLIHMLKPGDLGWDSANDLFEDYVTILETFEEGLGQFMVAAGLIIRGACERGRIDPEQLLREYATAWAIVESGLHRDHRGPGEIIRED